MEKQGFFSLVQQKWKGCTVLLSSFLFEKTEYCLIHLYSITSKNHSSQEIFINLQWQYYVVLKWEAILNSPFLPHSSGGTHKATLPVALHFIPWSWVTRMLDRAEITDHKHPAGRQLAALSAGRGTAAGQLWKQLLIQFSGCSINAGQCPGFNKVLGNGKF